MKLFPACKTLFDLKRVFDREPKYTGFQMCPAFGASEGHFPSHLQMGHLGARETDPVSMTAVNKRSVLENEKH